MTFSPKKVSLLAVLLALAFLFAEGPKLVSDARAKFERRATDLQSGLDQARNLAKSAAEAAAAAQARADALVAQIAPLQGKVTAGTATASDVAQLKDLVARLQAEKGARGIPGPQGPAGAAGAAGAKGATGATGQSSAGSSSTTTTTQPAPTTTTTRPRASTTTTTRRCLVSLPGVAKVGC